MDEAALDFGYNYNQRSIDNGEEWGATIYAVEGGYTYTEPRTDHKPDEVDFSLPPGGEQDALAGLHTHGEYIDDDGNRFSDYDKDLSKQMQKPSYVALPNGEMQKFDPLTDETTVLANDLPSDPKDPSTKKKDKSSDNKNKNK